MVYILDDERGAERPQVIDSSGIGSGWQLPVPVVKVLFKGVGTRAEVLRKLLTRRNAMV